MDSLPKGIGDQFKGGLLFVALWRMSDMDSLPKGIGDHKRDFQRRLPQAKRSDMDSLPKGIGDKGIFGLAFHAIA